ncbi:SusC/RagA family TonB-linked outer membrane protein [Chitinophaga polysaccharea]|uniref:SusC/RagA family TonB-linked outer membrane protein n=1 Tax=Chitinophaga TaxID=79328 RepID=UPI00145526F2|nr:MULTISPECIES: SusC/RagA family TonB-linked outer membrane protein [Chitinophaga]NLR61058.1 SusC/RagA family TonB-linked outer membrane protein [Chitinophaga polysaccharea]NLU96267.1 SusC/RagA family TonB-linked outer membrane protein [Chitinophaga sp. Ak27]
MGKRSLIFFFLSLLPTLLIAQGKKISGKVTNTTDGSAIPGISVIIQGTSSGTQTDAQGNYTIQVPPGKVLIFRAVGFNSKTATVGNSSVINVSLNTRPDDLSEVIVVAYGQSKKEALTGSVAAIKTKDIEKRPVSNAISVLEGAAGIQVNNTTGTPGATPSVRIRGFTSVNGDNSPLYVIDGVPFAGNVTDINPADIESVSVLKDAAAGALYGNKASNGVIIMTTKRAAKGNTSVNFIMNQGVYTRGIKEYEVLSANEFMETMWKGYRNNLLSTNPTTYPTKEAAGAKATSSLISDYLYLNIYDKPANQLFDANGKMVADARILPGYAGDLNWFRNIEKTGYRQDYALNGSANNKKNSLYYSVGYLDENGYITNTSYKRFTGRINADIQARDWFKYGFNLSGTHQITSNVSATSSSAASFVNPFMYARSIAPIYPVHLHDAITGDFKLDRNGQQQYDDGSTSRNQYVGRHTIWENELNRDMIYRNTVNGQVFLDFKFLKDFTFSVKGDLNVRNSDEHVYNNAVIGDGAGNEGRASRTNYRYKNYTGQEILNWSKSYGLHSIEALAGHENYYDNYNYLYGYKTTEAFANATELVNFTKITNLTDYQVDYRSEGYFARARYSYDEKYFLDGSFRRDGSSKFYKDNRWGNFWSLGGSWLISREAFFAPLSRYADYAKLRASYGQIGNDLSASTYAYMTLYTLDQNSNRIALYKTQNEARDLRWETSSSISAALETRLFNRANLTVEYFDKRSQNLLFDFNLPLSAGATSSSNAEAIISKNLGTVSNKGIELSLDVDVLRKRDFKWNVGVNATWLTNKIVTLPEQNREKGIVSGNYKYMEGHSIYDFWTYQYAGVDQMTGSALYLADDANFDPKDTNGAHYKYLVNINGTNYTTYTTYAKRDWSGSAIPKVFGSFSTGITYKDFTLSGIFTYSLGGKVYDDSYLSLMTMSGSVGQMHKDVLKSWDGAPEGMTATSADRINPKGVPVMDFSKSNFSNTMSTRFLQDGSYLVIKNIALAYQMPGSLLRKIDIKSARLTASIENLATFTKLQGMNPQQSFNGRSLNAFVTPRVLSFGINIGL